MPTDRSIDELEKAALGRLRTLCDICENMPVGPSGFYSSAEKCSNDISVLAEKGRAMQELYLAVSNELAEERGWEDKDKLKTCEAEIERQNGCIAALEAALAEERKRMEAERERCAKAHPKAGCTHMVDQREKYCQDCWADAIRSESKPPTEPPRCETCDSTGPPFH